MRFFLQSLDDCTVTLAAGTAHENYPVTNLANRDFFKQLRTESSSTTTLDIILDLTAVRSCNYLLLGDKNFDGTINLYVDAADTGGGWDTAVTSANLSANEANTCITFTSATKRYWKLICGSFSTETDYLSNIFMGLYYDTPKESQLEFQEIAKLGDTQNYKLAYYEQRFLMNWNPHWWYYTREYSDLTFRGFTNAQIGTFNRQFFNFCGGLEKPFYIAHDEGSTYTTSIYTLVRFGNTDLTWRRILTDYYETTINLVEQV